MLPHLHRNTSRHTQVHTQTLSPSQTHTPPTKTHIKTHTETHRNTQRHTDTHKHTHRHTNTDTHITDRFTITPGLPTSPLTRVLKGSREAWAAGGGLHPCAEVRGPYSVVKRESGNFTNLDRTAIREPTDQAHLGPRGSSVYRIVSWNREKVQDKQGKLVSSGRSYPAVERGWLKSWDLTATHKKRQPT